MKIRKKILIVSDSHGRNHNLWRVLEKEKPFDILIHCGDYQGSEPELIRQAGCEVRLVGGNMDYNDEFPEEQLVTFGSHKAFVVHGHKYRLYAGLQSLYYSAMEKGADFAIFGHLHKPIIDSYGGITFLNPGSITDPRQEDRIPTYMILLLMEDGSVEYEIKRV